MKKLAFLLLALVCLASPAFAATYYVHPTGSDAALGTLGAPFLTINHCVNVMVAGDTCNVRAGTYTEQLTNGDFANGSAGNPITLQAYNSEVVTIKPTVTDGYVIDIGQDYITLKDLIIDGTNVSNSSDVFLLLIRAAADHVQFTNLEVRYSTCTGIDIAGDDNTLTNLNVHDNGLIGSNQCHGVYIGGSGGPAINNTIDGGSYHDNGGFNIHHYSGGVRDNTGLVVKNASIYRAGFKNGVQNSTTGVCNMIVTDCSSGCQIYNNKIYDSLGCGISNGFANGTTGLLIYYNTIYNNGNFDGQEGVLIGASATNTTFQNNILRANGQNYSNSGTGTTCTKNLITAAPGGCTNTVTTDPGFVNAGSGNFHLSLVSSSAVGAATCVGTVLTDADGVTRGATCDAGAYEFTATSIRIGAISSILRVNQN